MFKEKKKFECSVDIFKQIRASCDSIFVEGFDAQISASRRYILPLTDEAVIEGEEGLYH